VGASESNARQGAGARPGSRARSEVAASIQKLVETQAIQHDQRILCYGCGQGPDVNWLRIRKFNVAGYDPYPPFGYDTMPEGRFDFVLMVFLLTRLKDDETRRNIIAKAFEKVRPGGHLAIVSRNIRKHGEAAGFQGENALQRYVGSLVAEDEVAAMHCPALPTGDRSETVLVQRAGIYEPRQPFTWVEDGATLEEACRMITRYGVVGLDVETTLDEPRTLCTVQLAIPGHTWIVDALALQALDPLKALMGDEGVEKIIHNALFEEQMLATRAIPIRSIFDTLPASRKKYKGKVEGGHKLGEVCERELGIFLDKEMQTSDWTTRPLSPEQLAYAAIDAEVLLGLYEVFKPPRLPENMNLFADG